MSEGPAKPQPRWFQFSLRTLFISVTVLAIGLGIVIGGLRWIASQVSEGEQEWRRESVTQGKWDEFTDADIDDLIKGWFDEREIKSMKNGIRQRREANPNSSSAP